jgi:hypothetical protein
MTLLTAMRVVERLGVNQVVVPDVAAGHLVVQVASSVVGALASSRVAYQLVAWAVCQAAGHVVVLVATYEAPSQMEPHAVVAVSPTSVADQVEVLAASQVAFQLVMQCHLTRVTPQIHRQ